MTTLDIVPFQSKLSQHIQQLIGLESERRRGAALDVHGDGRLLLGRLLGVVLVVQVAGRFGLGCLRELALIIIIMN